MVPVMYMLSDVESARHAELMIVRLLLLKYDDVRTGRVWVLTAAPTCRRTYSTTRRQQDRPMV